MAKETAEYRCPRCRSTSHLGSPSFPFCSRRCRLIDLGSWMNEEYKISWSIGPLDAEAFDPDQFELPELPEATGASDEGNPVE